MTRRRNTNNPGRPLRTAGGIGVLTLSLVVAAATAHGAVRTPDPFAAFTPLGDRALSGMRGGLDRGPFKYDFVVTIRSMVQRRTEGSAPGSRAAP